MQGKKEIVMVDTKRLYHHPDNPRKDIGDITELTKSIEKHGIVQNMTIIPIGCLKEDVEKQADPEKVSLLSDFYVLIGNRRMEGAKAAGVEQVPCRIISKITKDEQITIMLEENMQRSDLTIPEQAESFQLLLDLGNTVDQIAEKSGFSKTTVYHRVNLAKLDKTLLKEKEKDDSFQMSLKDMALLEQIDDVEARNKILKEADSSDKIGWKVQNYLENVEKNRKNEEIKQFLEDNGVKVAPEKYSQEQYNGKWETVKTIETGNGAPKKLGIKDNGQQLYYYKYWNGFEVVRKVIKKKETDYEKEQKEKKAKSKELNSRKSKLIEEIRLFMVAILTGKIDLQKNTTELFEQIWNAIEEIGSYVKREYYCKVITNKDSYMASDEEKEDAKKIIDKAGIQGKLIATLYYGLISYSGDITDYQNHISEKCVNVINSTIKVLEIYGWKKPEEYLTMLDGTDPLYTPKKEQEEGE